MVDNKAEELLANFAASLPRYLRLYLEGRSAQWTLQDYEAYRDGDPKKDQALIREYEQRLEACPKQRRAYIERQRSALESQLPRVKRGRPRKDADVEEARLLRARGKTWGQVGAALGKSGDAARKLTKSRESRTGK